MARRGLFRTIEPSDLGPARLLADVLDALERPPPARPPVDLNGLATMATELEALVDGIRGPA
jgi:predicted glycosyltransferase